MSDVENVDVEDDAYHNERDEDDYSSSPAKRSFDEVDEASEAEDDHDYDENASQPSSPPKKVKVAPSKAKKAAAGNKPVTRSKKTLAVKGSRDAVPPPPLVSRIDTTLASQSIQKPFKTPSFVNGTKALTGSRNGTTLGLRRAPLMTRGALHDPETEGAIILFAPKTYSLTEQLEAKKSTAAGKDAIIQEVHVVIDPILGKVLRPHQIEGVRFMWECVTGVTSPNAFGCIMADEMGLGKTLQCITLLWTLLRQSPTPGKPTIEKAIIACPSSLVRNWENELKKWLGPDRVRPLACDNKGTKNETMKLLDQWACSKGRSIVHPVLIISYESLRGYASIIKQTEIGLMLCDEGHRLKNSDSQTYQELNSLNAKRRVILSGTPIQNDLTEYFALLSFAIPEVLGTEAQFRKLFEIPILRGRDADASDKDKQISNERLNELLAIANKFIIRRTADLLTKYLPVKYEHVVFCKLTDLQSQIYQEYSKSKDVKKLLAGNGNQPLKAITFLKKLCNHPALVSKEDIPDVVNLPPNLDFNQCQSEFAGKMLLLDRMLTMIRKTTNDKIVLISNYTQTLDLFDKLCRTRQWGVLRLDGTMTIPKRQKLVEKFNDPTAPEFVFLLSSKAGGCGLNLIGANRLVLFDPDWNPANDGQALARVWRDGQKKTCFIYRFIATGSIEEKIFQRQAHKQSLSSCVVDEAGAEEVERHFSLESLRQLFQLNLNTMCDTHDAFNCKRCTKQGIQHTKPKEGAVTAGAGGADTSSWNHFHQSEVPKAYDTVLKQCAAETGVVTYVFQNKSHEQTLVRMS
ncbi:hypothetical protein SeMB42_g02517 [Synchytrium endobioticum]|uniref:DNA repair and recombination protein RAD54 and RAD54-like protein n=1 Tax=Synchytrium endobioticum TaxID=286115 RepID=A0A507DDE4_9FUNG|nr:hypothetical protein SeLEV6574_g02262 [Synchytrium endobioticum]TPX49719.1 hypothetical protein SeMB42_g02517 [Synchytrium endobioticum]